ASGKVLVVDDTPTNVKLLADVLRIRGYTVTTATNGEDALPSIATYRPDLVLLHVMTPGISGYDVCRRLRSEAATALLPVVLVTSLDAQQERIKGLEPRAHDFPRNPHTQP